MATAAQVQAYKAELGNQSVANLKKVIAIYTQQLSTYSSSMAPADKEGLAQLIKLTKAELDRRGGNTKTLLLTGVALAAAWYLLNK